MQAAFPTPDTPPGGAPTLSLVLADAAATDRFGHRLAPALRPADAVLLRGPLGAGKSALARSAIRTLLGDPEAEVPSPSYTLVNVYDLPSREGVSAREVWHADLYRLSGPEEAAELGLADAFATAIVLLEWPDRLGSELPERRLEISLTMAGDSGRRAELSFVGGAWQRVRDALKGST